MNNKLTILYLHGLNSNGNSRTAKTIKQECPNWNVLCPTLPVNCDEAISKIKSVLSKNHVDIIIGTSLGGFLALQCHNYFRIAVNPTLHPSKDIVKLGVDENIANTYTKYENTIIDEEDSELTYALFGRNDKLISYSNEFLLNYQKDHVLFTDDEHRLSVKSIKNNLIPFVNKIKIEEKRLQKNLHNIMKVDFIYKNVLNEHYVNVFDKNDMIKYLHDVYDILTFSYSSIGGMFGISSPEDLIRKCDMWKLVRKNGKIVAVACYTFKRGGRKSIYSGTDGSDEGKNGLYSIMKEDAKLTDRKVWSECSGKMEHLRLKHGFTPIPASVVKQLLPDKEIKELDNDIFHYYRKIGNEYVKKICVGNI